MSRYITSEEQLRSFFPNSMKAVAGEKGLFEKLERHLDDAENMLHRELCPEEACAPYVAIAAAVVAWTAISNAGHGLDVVLTPNGFGVVSTQAIAPASQARVADFLRQCRERRNKSVGVLLASLDTDAAWADTPQYARFHRTLFPGITLCTRRLSADADMLAEYDALSDCARDCEDDFAARFFGEELMARLRREPGHTAPLNIYERTVAGAIRTQVLRALDGENPHYHRLIDAVDYIRQRPDAFPLWHGSRIAELFQPPVFRNEKNSGGYFF